MHKIINKIRRRVTRLTKIGEKSQLKYIIRLQKAFARLKHQKWNWKRETQMTGIFQNSDS